MSHQGLMIQRFLNKHGLGDNNSTPNTSGPHSMRSPSKTGGKNVSSRNVTAEKNEEFYVNNCPIELASICVKLLIDVLI
jgi:hypothetical protein